MPPECDVLSQDELRKKLYRTFKDRGVLDTLKTQLRNLLVHELMGPVRRGEPPRSVPVEGSGLLVGACNALVADHLRRCGYEYSLSVFFPESGLASEKAFTVRDLLQLVQVDPTSRLHSSLVSGTDEENQKGFLLRFLRELAAWRQAPPTRHVGTQTDARQDSLAEKLRLIDDAFADARPRRVESLEAKLSDYKRVLEERLRAEMRERLRHLRDTEVANVQAQERRRRERDLAELRGAFESAWRAKCESLTSREKEAVERFRRHQEIEAKEVYAQRQLLLKDLDSLREREAELKQRVEAFELNQKLHEEQNKSTTEALRRREQDVKRLEETYDRQLKDALLKYQLELKDDYIVRTNQLLAEEKRNKEEAVRLQEELAAVNSKQEELRQSLSRVRELELELESLKAQSLTVAEQNRALSGKLKDAGDHSRLREEKLELQAENRRLERELGETRAENLRLLGRVAAPDPEPAALREALRRAEEAAVRERGETEALRAQLRGERARCAELTARARGFEVSARSLTARVADLEEELRDTRAALQSAVCRGPSRERPGSAWTPSRADLPDEPLGPTDVPAAAPRSPHAASDGGSPDSDLEFVAAARARMEELEREAERLDRAFRTHRRRAPRSRPRSPVPPAPAPRPLATAAADGVTDRLGEAPGDAASVHVLAGPAERLSVDRGHTAEPSGDTEFLKADTHVPKENEGSSRAGDLPSRFEPDALHPAGDMARVDAGAPAAAPGPGPCPSPGADQRQTGEQDDDTWEQRRRRERRDAVDRERRELERLDQQRRMIEESLKIETDSDGGDAGDRAARGDDAMDRYMRLVQRGQESASAEKSSDVAGEGGSSPVDTLPSGDRGGSPAGSSHDDAEDVW